jgi:hypothetical protein
LTLNSKRLSFDCTERNGASEMIKFIVKCSQKLNDGDTAIVEEYHVDSEDDINKVIIQYTQLSVTRRYVG